MTNDHTGEPIPLGPVHSVVLFVNDVEAAGAWYGRMLGARPETRREGFIRFALGHAFLCFHRRDAKASAESTGQVVYWTVENLDSALARFVAAGATIYRAPIAIEDGGRICQLKDPFGCVLALAQQRRPAEPAE